MATNFKSLLLVVQLTTSILTSGPCFSNNFLGTYRDTDSQLGILAVSDETCLQFWDAQLDSAHYVPAPDANQQLVWIEKVDIDPKLENRLPRSQTALDDFWMALQQPHLHFETPNQEVISTDDLSLNEYDIHYHTDTAALISLHADRAKLIETVVPPFWRMSLLPKRPIQHATVHPESIQVVRNILSRAKFDPVIASIVNNISIPQIKNDIRFLTGEDKLSGIVSRHSFSRGARTAAQWLKDRVEDTGATCRFEYFLFGFAPNIICRYTAVRDTNATVLISAHYDSRGSFGSVRAPGANDDGSGTTGILAIARTIGRKDVRFHSHVELAFFAGEEQGLVGSRFYAHKLSKAGANVTLMVQADMIAYRAPEEPPQLGLPLRYATPEVTQLVANISAIYSPELTVGFTSVCCSDHQSFMENGFPATWVFERAGPVADPMYHNSGDLSEREGYDFDQLYAIAKVQFATLLHAAEFEL